MGLSIKSVILSTFCHIILHVSAVEVSTRSGVIIGSDHLRGRNGQVIYSFTGVPYAQPPVGKLRFKEPQPVEPWETPFNATGKCPACAQSKVKGSTPGKFEIIGQEDCLSLNIFTSALGKENRFPVILYIHGGAFKMLSTMAEPEFLVGEVVLVDITYRLGALGFLTTGNEFIPGNAGLKDQVQALKWVHENIENFGGDPNLVTVFGNSAGGASAHLLLLSPLTKGLVHRGISASGTAPCPWAMRHKQVAIDRTKALAILAGCPSEPSRQVLECLQELPVRSVLAMEKKFMDEYLLPIAAFGPVVEEPNTTSAFLTDDPGKIESEIPWLTGINPAEYMIYPSYFHDTVKRNGLNLEEQLNLFMKRWLLDGFKIPREGISTAANRIKQFYFGDSPISWHSLENMDDMVTDGWFLTGLTDAVSKYKGPTYLYYYNYLQHDNVSFSSIWGPGLRKELRASHFDDLLSLFPMSSFFPNRQMTSELDLQVSEKMIYLWTHFAKHGNFSMNNITRWEPLPKDSSKLKHLHINATGFTQEEDLLTDRVNFWKSLLRDLREQGTDELES